jgi:hypothetical protein
VQALFIISARRVDMSSRFRSPMRLATLAAEDLDGCEIPLRFEGEDRPYLLQKRLERTCGGEGGAAGRLRHDSQIRSI